MYNLIYKDKCLFVCMELIQIHISEPISTKLCTRLPLGLEEVVGYVWTRNSWPLRIWALFLWRPLQNHGHKMAVGATVFRDTLTSVISTGVRVTSPTLRCRRRRSHTRQPYIRDSSGSSPNVRKWHRGRRQSHPPQRPIPFSGGCSRHATDITFNRATGPSATALYPSF